MAWTFAQLKLLSPTKCFPKSPLYVVVAAMSVDDNQQSEQQSGRLETAAEFAEAERSTAAVGDRLQESVLLDGERAESERVDPCESDDDDDAADSIARAGRPATAVGTAASDAAASSGQAAGIAAAPPPLTMKKRIAALKEAQKLLKEDSKRYAKDIRNAERRSKRLKARVQGLTDNDLSEVLSLRAEQVALHALRKGQSSRKEDGPQQPSRSPAAGSLCRSSSTVNVFAGPDISPGRADSRGTSRMETGQ